MSLYHLSQTAAVVVIEWQQSLLFIRRQERSGDPWSGHFSFPGGRPELADKNLAATACREVKEEVGLNLEKENLTHPIPPLKTHFGRMDIQPFYIKLKEEQKIKEDKKEVKYSKWVPLSMITDFSIRQRQFLNAYDLHEEYVCIPIDDYYIWGVTLEIVDKMFGENSLHANKSR